jgi:hypothetical protein
MKRTLCLALALTLLGSTAASADGWDRGFGRGFRHHHGGDGAALGFGLGILALGIIAAESAHNRDRYRSEDGYYDRGDDDRDHYSDRNRSYQDDRDRGDDDDGAYRDDGYNGDYGDN